MKPQPRFSRPVLGLTVALLAMLALMSWVRVKRPQQQPQEPTPVDTALPSESRADTTQASLDLPPPEQRAGDSPNFDLKPTDPLPAAQLLIKVVDENNQGVPGAQVRARILHREHVQPRSSSQSLVTDRTGAALVPLPPAQDLGSLDLSVSHDDYSGRKVSWSTTTGEVIPGSYTFKLGQGIAIGGVVLEETGAAVPGAKLRFSRFWTGSDRMNPTGEEADFPTRTALTDSEGKWFASGLPPELLDRIRLTLTHPDFVQTNLTIGGTAEQEARLRAGTHVIILNRGLAVAGRVLSESGQPIEKAQVWAGKMNFSGTQETMSDAQGVFRFGNLKGGDLQFSVLAKGFRPEVRNADVTEGMAELIFSLARGAVVRGIVQDEAGEPVAGVRISLESGSGGVSQDYRFEMTSGKDGRFEWDSAPKEPRNFAILKGGYMAKRGQTLRPDEENVITIRKSPKVQGVVLDAETGNPIHKFRIGIGRNYHAGEFYANYPGMRDYSAADGTFQLQLNEEQNKAIKAEADDYSEKVEELPPAENGIVHVELRLRPSAALRGVLVDSQGQLVAGGTVAIALETQMGALRLSNGRLSGSSASVKITTSDAEGRFTLASPPESGGLVVAAAQTGFGSATVDQVRAAGYLVLQEFGSIEGVISVGGTPVQGQEFTFNLRNPTVMPEWSTSRATSDADGRFRLDKVPSGEVSVVRLIPTGGGAWSHSHRTEVVVQPGQTSVVRFGEDGAVVQGAFSLDYQPAEGEKLVFSGELNTRRAEPGQSFSSPAQAQAFYASPEWREQMRKSKTFAVAVDPAGVFHVDSIPPGEYTLTIDARKAGVALWEGRPVATATLPVTIPEGTAPNTPIYLKDIVLRPK